MRARIRRIEERTSATTFRVIECLDSVVFVRELVVYGNVVNTLHRIKKGVAVSCIYDLRTVSLVKRQRSCQLFVDRQAATMLGDTGKKFTFVRDVTKRTKVQLIEKSYRFVIAFSVALAQVSLPWPTRQRHDETCRRLFFCGLVRNFLLTPLPQ
jgi:hypothetical protein